MLSNERSPHRKSSRSNQKKTNTQASTAVPLVLGRGGEDLGREALEPPAAVQQRALKLLLVTRGGLLRAGARARAARAAVAALLFGGGVGSHGV
jgi:hypothetical protein